MAVELATGYVSLVASAQGIHQSIARELGAPVEAEATKAGDKAGKGFGGKFTAGLAVVGVAAGAALVAGVAQGLERGKLNDKLAAQINLSPAEATKAGSVAGDLYANAYGESLEQVNAAVGAVGTTLADMTSASEAELGDLSAKALDLATAFDLDVATAVSSTGILMRTGLAADANEAFDLITAGMQEMPAGLREELLEASNEYAGFFADLGIDGPQAFGLLTTAAQDGMYGIDKTGDAIKEFTIRATDMSTLSVGAFNAIGLEAGDMANRFLEGGEVAQGAFRETVEGLLAIEDPAERANTAIALFGTPLEDLGVNEIPDFLGSLVDMESGLGDVEGRAAAMGDTLNDNTATSIESLKRGAMMELTDFIEQRVIPTAERLHAWFQDTPMAVEVAKVAIGGLAAAAVLHFTIVAATALASSASMALAAAAWVANWVLMGVQSLINAARIAAAWLIAMGPIALVIAAVVGVVALIVIHFDTIKETIAAAWQWVKDKTSEIWTALTGWLSRTWDDLWAKATDTGRRILASLTEAWVRLQVATMEKINAVVGFFTELPGRVVGAIQAGAAALVGAGRWAVERLLEGIKAVAEGAGGLFAWYIGLPGEIFDRFMRGASKLVDLGKGMIEKIIEGIKKAPGAIKDAISSIIPDNPLPGWIPVIGGNSGDGPGRPLPGGNTLSKVQNLISGTGARVSSTYRTPERNAAVGGSPRSYHMDRGNPAVDIVAPSAAILDAIHARLKAAGPWRELLWRVPNHAPGDNMHIHVAHRGEDITPDSPGWRPGLAMDERLRVVQVGERITPAGPVGPGVSAGGFSPTIIAPEREASSIVREMDRWYFMETAGTGAA